MNQSSTGTSTSSLSHEARSLQWLLGNLVEEVPGIRSVAVISSDGLLLCSSDADGETVVGAEAPLREPGSGPAKASGDLATVVSGLASLTDGAARLMNAGQVKQSVVAMENGCLFVMAISDGSLLGVHASPECDMSVVAYHMALFVGRAGHVLTPELRVELSKARAAAPAVTPTESEQ
ncbi:roadblock/LC7 domain-containing protein [Streptantibioticus rubrisoli]|uniref:Roadblock/LC7 domain-containing protein n=1 Tax=Streptantibioticus rubrisoli TaxID=1387313 RepID=A0ABT1PBU0_9ACTN|nr:roadblock/LC7 domain-containing protein [Streptantibioticus rubrisoli]MCQ4042819.1 roadblock/LC7 domain-containing protein [Streptantibioticus rubrisoli]